MYLSMTMAQTHTEAASRPIITHFTSQCAWRNSVISERSDEVSGSTCCATSGFIARVPPNRPEVAHTATRPSFPFRRPGDAPQGHHAGHRRRAALRPEDDAKFRENARAVRHRRPAKISPNLTKLGHHPGHFSRRQRYLG